MVFYHLLLAATMVVHPPVTDPIALACKVADKVVDNAQFNFEYVLQAAHPDAETVDFGRSCLPCEGVAYALSTMNSQADQLQTFEVGCRGPLKIWIDDQLVFCRTQPVSFTPILDEKTYELSEKFTVRLSQGNHQVLVKSQAPGNCDWAFFMQSPDMSRYADEGKRIKCSLKQYAPKIDLVNWLIIGTFEGDIHTVCPPEEKVEFHKIYHSGGKQLAWNVPRINMLTNNKEGSRSIAWNYHVGGFVWGLQLLSQVTGNDKYAGHAAKWCEYSLFTEPVVKYQATELHAVRSMNFGQSGRPMLDYVSAPAIPFITRLVYERNDFPQKEKYIEKATDVIRYLTEKQFRIDGIFGRTYTEHPTVWADDMFMGIPYLVYWAKYTSCANEQERFLLEASRQLIKFNSLLFDPDDQLYRQACYPMYREVKIPFWSRGNGWAIWATCEVLDALNNDHANYNTVIDIYRKHIDGLLLYQDDLGFWHNILNMNSTVRESSGAAMFVMAIARGINNGWLPRTEYGAVLERSWHALITFLDDNNDFNGVKGGTNFSDDPMDYEKVPFVTNDTHGLLPFIFACMEMDKYYKR